MSTVNHKELKAVYEYHEKINQLKTAYELGILTMQQLTTILQAQNNVQTI